MRAKTFAKHRIHQYLEAAYPGLDTYVNFIGLHEAIVTDVSGDRIRAIYKGEQVYRTEAWRGGTSPDDSSEMDHHSILLDVWDGGGCGSGHGVDIGGMVKGGEQ